ncbi:hypothetical protein Aau02nite_12680 [Amorphoplanes auranticolor]|uniref:Recombination endonuclease VII n=1 Tax=Actinoplanes auranticolor TaxID=47988 RepID=A0A919VQ00_9ACTN|nr:hypothetical protein Aau02nite_12680 [Actinoplanes auranticolor]
MPKGVDPHQQPDAVRRRNLRRLYGITPEQYDDMRARQDFRCAICKRQESEIERRPGGRPRKDGLVTLPMALQVDHCHGSGAVRKLLCGPCNRILGNASEDITRLQACIEYLRSFGAE